MDDAPANALLRVFSNDSLAAVRDIPLTGHGVITDAEALSAAASAPLLEANYPNPFTYQTVIRLRLPYESHVVLQIRDLLDRHLITLADGRYGGGLHEFIFRPAQLDNGAYLLVAVMQGRSVMRLITIAR